MLKKVVIIELNLHNNNCIEGVLFVIQNIFIVSILFILFINIWFNFFGELKIIFEVDIIPTEWSMSLKGSNTFQLCGSHLYSI